MLRSVGVTQPLNPHTLPQKTLGVGHSHWHVSHNGCFKCPKLPQMSLINLLQTQILISVTEGTFQLHTLLTLVIFTSFRVTK